MIATDQIQGYCFPLINAMDNSKKIALEFIRYILQQNPEVKSFTAIYDAMAREASARSFHNLGYEELSMAGISFSLLDTSKLERLISEAKQSLMVE